MQASTSRSLPADIGPEAEDNRKTETEVAANSTGSDVEILENQLDARANVQHATSSTAADAQATATTANDVQATATTRATTVTWATTATRAAPAARAAANALASAAALVAFSAVRAAVRAIFVRFVISKALGVSLQQDSSCMLTAGRMFVYGRQGGRSHSAPSNHTVHYLLHSAHRNGTHVICLTHLQRLYHPHDTGHFFTTDPTSRFNRTNTPTGATSLSAFSSASLQISH
ncbi:uncharacterized protein F5891DRAFT_978641 [Suillus fuscotomentosus]|uniref:Uncharacterized protein n=1 Tax=Suillus fuscotomentosus TaxID=1912939 RepID=A0AAD4HLQ5_9AGAM|nr:uncharacterized protein F5891DRAFT_978641 [Suillus fuscotomentosus]KAG1902310.1 hypothetical protein F5891DRAFT_978641 [Suillus fuscotomentosus]